MKNRIMELADAYALETSRRGLHGYHAWEARGTLRAEVDSLTKELADANADLLLKCETIRSVDAAIEEYRRECVALQAKVEMQTKQIERVTAQLLEALKGLLALDEEHHQRYPGDEDVCQEVRAARASIAEASTQPEIQTDTLGGAQ